MTPPHRQARSRARAFLLVWLALTVLGSGVQAAAWVWHAPGLIRSLSNINTAMNLPVQVPWLFLVGSRGHDHLIAIVIMNGIGYGFWVLVVATAMFLRRRAAGWWRARRDASSLSPPFDSHRDLPIAPDPSRRAFISAAALALPAVTLPGGAAYAAGFVPSDLRTRRLTVPIKDLPLALDGLTLVQISDTHLGPRVPAEWIDHAVRTAIDLKPDLFCLTGDYVGGDDSVIDQAVAQFEPLTRAAPTVAVLGNHDWWADGPAIKRAFAALGIPCIDNDRVFLSPARTIVRVPVPGSLAIVGLGDLIGDTTDIARAFRDVDPAQPVLLLAHEPDTAELPDTTGPDAPRIDLMLTGHTHGGQIRLPLVGAPMIPSEFGQKYAAGLVAGPRFPVHITTGVGISMLPVRFGVPPEINHITLVRG